MVRNSISKDATGLAIIRHVSRRIYTCYLTRLRRCYLPRGTRIVDIIIVLWLIEDAV